MGFSLQSNVSAFYFADKYLYCQSYSFSSSHEAPILWSPDAKSQLIRKNPDVGKDWRQEKGMTEDEIIGWHHQLNGHEFGQAPGDGEGQGSLVCCNTWGHKELDMTEWLNKNNNIYGCESWTIEKAEGQRTDAFKLWWWRRLLRVPWTARSNQSILKESDIEYSLEGLMLKLKLQYFDHLIWRAISLGKAGERDDRGWDGWMASLTRWTWVWANLGRWWRTGKPGMLWSMGLQRVRHDWATWQQVKGYLKQFFLPGTPCSAMNKNYKACQKAKNSMWREE